MCCLFRGTRRLPYRLPGQRDPPPPVCTSMGPAGITWRPGLSTLCQGSFLRDRQMVEAKGTAARTASGWLCRPRGRGSWKGPRGSLSFLLVL